MTRPMQSILTELCQFALTLALSRGEREQLPPIFWERAGAEGCFTLS